MHLNISWLTTGFLLAVSSLSFSGGMGGVIVEESPAKVTIPCQRSSFHLGLYGMYLQPNYSGQLSYLGSNATVSTSGTIATTQNIHVDEKWDWAGMIEAGYNFNCGNDITISWLYHDNNQTHSYRSSDLFQDLDAGVFSNVPFNNTAATNLTFHRLDVEMGQHVDFGEIKDIRFHGGFEYASFDFTITANGTDVTGIGFANSSQKTAKFDGFGPRVGMDLSYYVLDGLSIYGKGSVAALVGTIKSQNRREDIDPLIGDFTITFNESRDNQIVPVIALKFGLNYSCAIYQNIFSLDAGYMWSDYMAIARNLDANTGRPSDANFYLQGPYLGIKWTGQA